MDKVKVIMLKTISGKQLEDDLCDLQKSLQKIRTTLYSVLDEDTWKSRPRRITKLANKVFVDLFGANGYLSIIEDRYSDLDDLIGIMKKRDEENKNIDR